MKIEYDPIHGDFVLTHSGTVRRVFIDTPADAWEFLRQAKSLGTPKGTVPDRPPPIRKYPEHLIHRYDERGRPIIELSDLELELEDL